MLNEKTGLLVAAFWLMSFVQSAAKLQPDPTINCDQCVQWNRERQPFRVFGNTYYVGAEGLSAVLISTDDGLVLLDGGLPQTAPLIEAHIQQLGFRARDIRFILNSHAHFDHAGGIAALQRLSGAIVAASPAGARALEQGRVTADDPQVGYAESDKFSRIPKVRVLEDGETLRVGGHALTANFTPGHTPGGTTWTWRSCEAGRCLDIVYADSLNAVSSPGFRFTSVEASFRRSIARVEQLPCDILISVHPGLSNLFRNLERRNQGDPQALVDAQACRVYAANARQALDKRIAEER